MTIDTIVQEVRDHREEIAKECDYDLHKIFARARAMQPMNPILDFQELGHAPQKLVEPGSHHTKLVAD